MLFLQINFLIQFNLNLKKDDSIPKDCCMNNSIKNILGLKHEEFV